MKRAMMGMMLAGALSLLASSSMAADTHFYHGTNCHPRSAANFYEYDQFGFYNSSVSTVLELACPVATQNTLVSATARVYDRSSGQEVQCNFVVTDSAGALVSQSGTQSTSSFGPGIKALNFNNGGDRWGVLFCTVPPLDGMQRSHFTSYWTG